MMEPRGILCHSKRLKQNKQLLIYSLTRQLVGRNHCAILTKLDNRKEIRLAVLACSQFYAVSFSSNITKVIQKVLHAKLCKYGQFQKE